MNTTLPDEILVLQEISSAVVRERNVRVLLGNIIDILHRRMGMLRGTFALLDGDELRIEASARALNAEERALGRYHIGEGITGRVAQSGQAEIVPDVRKDRRFLNNNEPLAFVCVPLVHLGQVIGTLSVDRVNESGVVTPGLRKDVALLEIIANITADAAAVCREERKEREALVEENRKLRDMLKGNTGELIGNCREMRAVYEQIRQVASSDATVLIRGASGTGKELVARAIQGLSARKNRPFVTLNCAALPENLVESELFGHEKGAFTGAVQRRIGRAELADGGTLFLDEIGDLSVPVQVKLLRFLQDRSFSRVGSSEELHSNVRFIAATSRNLEDLMARKLFREDLYYRLSVFPITMPDLAHRSAAPAVNMLLADSWPGNVRELENCIERAVLTTTDDCIHGYTLPPSLQGGGFTETPYGGEATQTLDEQLASFERRIIEEAVRRNNGNRSAAGRELGVSPRMMNYRMNRLGMA